MTRKHLLGIILCFCTSFAAAQEINCTVSINSDVIQGTNKSVFDQLAQSITEYMNTNKWTNMTFAEHEKIECSMMILVREVSGSVYNCEMQLQSKRPVYGTSYSTPILNFKDNDFNFSYQEGDRIEWQQNTFTTNLTAMLAYYCYLIIGMDMDSYSRLGGTPCFQQCESIVTTAQTASMESSELNGWSAISKKNSNRNRHAIINNLMDEAFQKYRTYFYEYHRLGLDEMISNVANARARIAKGMDVLKEANRARPATYIINTFLDAKSDELTNIFQKGTTEEKKKVYELLMDIDPTRQNTYDKINE